MNKSEIAALIDHTLLKANATPEQVRHLCQEAREYKFASVCVNPVYVKLAAEELRGSVVDVCSVIGFPLGATPTAVKLYESRQAITDGAAELDMVINIGALKAGERDTVQTEIAELADAAHEKGSILKVIIECALLSDEEKVLACQLAQAAGADFVKTSTGFSTGGATASDVRLMRQTVGPTMGVKAAGGIRSYADVLTMVEAGASRIGASAGVKIVAQASD
ncbi:MAG: deoxyribose-phosphate aldolase [Anaerolineae bacterium]|nr:deoxyribose-phosphate aldolase [Anaerolineae bacterium]